MMEISVFYLLFLTSSVKGVYFQPIAYTFPNGILSVNGSSSTGGCQPESCVMLSISGTSVNGCDCPTNTPVNGTLVDGVIPSIDTTQHGTWARELFTVNRNGQSSVIIGFEFSSQFSLRTTEIVLFQCPLQGIGITGVKVYSSFLFPQFIVTASILLTTLNSPPSENCQSLSTISIPVQPPMTSYNIYFIKFLYTGGSSVLQLNWLHLGEVRFSDHDMSPTVATVAILTTQLGESITSSVCSTNSLEAVTTLSFTINDDDVMLNTGTTQFARTMTITSTDMNIPATTADGMSAAISVPVYVGTLVGVFTILISITPIIALLCVYIKRIKAKQTSDGGDSEYDDVTEKATGLSEVSNPIEMKANEAYGTHQHDTNTVLEETQCMEAQYEELQ